MQNLRWVNQGHPQTLNIGVILLYVDAVFSILGGAAVGGGLGLLLGIGAGAAGLGIANNKRVAWYVGVAISSIVVLLILRLAIVDGIDELLDSRLVLGAIFPVAQFAALVHPMSRSYVKIYFE